MTPVSAFADPAVLPDEPTILAAGAAALHARALTLQQGTMVDATIIHAPGSTKSLDNQRNAEMRQA